MFLTAVCKTVAYNMSGGPADGSIPSSPKGDNMDKDFFKGKTYGEVIDDDTEMLHYADREKIEGLEIKYPRVYTDGHVSVLTDMNDYFVVFVSGKPKAMFSIYESHGVYIGSVRGVVVAYGHEDIHLYWIDTGEFTNIATR